MQSATSASAPSVTQSTTTNRILTASEQASENAAMAKMFSEVRKAEARAQAPQVTTIHAVMQLVDNATYSREALDNLSGLFAAIEQLADKHSTIRKLASTGKYMADDWENFNDSQQEEWQDKLNALKANSEGVTA
jgi:hypothetical protein